MNPINKAIKATFVISTFLFLNSANATTSELADCKQLQKPKTVLLVHATWCPHCQNFLPIYKAVSDLPEMKGYTFYTKENNSVEAVCDVSIYGVPMTLKHNMEKKIIGEVSQSSLIEFVKSED